MFDCRSDSFRIVGMLLLSIKYFGLITVVNAERNIGVEDEGLGSSVGVEGSGVDILVPMYDSRSHRQRV